MITFAHVQAERRRNLRAAFRFARQNGYGVRTAIRLAREDVAAGRLRHATSSFDKGAGMGAANDDGAHWVECPASIGLRFVGYADELADIGHTGWFTHPDGDTSDMLRGVVYQMPGRKGVTRFYVGRDNANFGAADAGGPAFIDFAHPVLSDSVGEAAAETARREAARDADAFAERAADKEREYQTAWMAGQAFADIGEEVRDARREVLSILREWRLERTATDREARPALADAIGDRIDSILDSIRDHRAKRATLKAGDDERYPFWPGDADLTAAFNDGAGL